MRIRRDEPLEIGVLLDALYDLQASLDPEHPEEEITLGVWDDGEWMLGFDYDIGYIVFDDAAIGLLDYQDSSFMLEAVARELLRDLERGRSVYEELSRDD